MSRSTYIDGRDGLSPDYRIVEADGTVIADWANTGVTTLGTGGVYFADIAGHDGKHVEWRPDTTSGEIYPDDEPLGFSAAAIKTALEAEGGTLATAAADAAAAKTAAVSADGKLDTALEAPTGYTRVTSATYGTLRAGTVIDAYAAEDTAYATPLVPNAVAASNGSWHIDLPDGATYTLVGRLTGYEDRTQEVTVP